jgi:hypothetical protein
VEGTAVTNWVRFLASEPRHDWGMKRDTYIDIVLEQAMPNASNEERLMVMAELWSLFDVVFSRLIEEERFDASAIKMVESDSRMELNSPPLL